MFITETSIPAVLVLIGVNLLSGTEVQEGSCPSGRESLLLATNVHVTLNTYWNTRGANFNTCLTLCRRDNRCGSLLFVRNSTQTECRLSETRSLDNVFPADARRPHGGEGLFYAEKICIQASCERMFAAEVLLGSEIDGHDDYVINNVSSAVFCLEACFAHTDFVCRSVEYVKDEHRCRLSRFDRFNRQGHFRQINNTTKSAVYYFDNACSPQPVTGEGTAEILLLGNLQHPFSLEEHLDVSLSKCGELCVRNNNFPCRSFLFGQKEGRQYCGLSHLNRIGLLPHPGSFQTTHILNYYEIVRDLDACDATDIHFELITGVFLTTTPFKESEVLLPDQCISTCRNDRSCRAVSIDYRLGRCRFHSENFYSHMEEHLRPDPTSALLAKICLAAGLQCHHRLWAFERIRNHQLIDGASKDSVIASTAEECMAACLEHRKFRCQAAEYNRQLQECHLIPSSRHTPLSSRVEVSLRPSKAAIDYYENNCFNEPRGLCNIQSTKGLMIVIANRLLRVSDNDRCREACLQCEDFVCRSYSYDTTTGRCLLSHQTQKTSSDESLVASPTIQLNELGACFEVNVSCEPRLMRVQVRTNAIFSGKIYAKSRPISCSRDIGASTDFELPVTLIGDDCDTQNNKEGGYTNIVVIQSNDYIVTALDKAIGVHCTYDTGNITESVQVVIGGNLTNTQLTRGTAETPQITLRIVDKDGLDKSTVHLGEPLKIQVMMEGKSAYGLFVRNMIATDDVTNSSLTLIDNKGCPLESRMVREMRSLDNLGAALESQWEAFAFTGSNSLRIETDVEMCHKGCRPSICPIASTRSEEDSGVVVSYGRKRRHSTPDVSTVRLSRKLEVISEEFRLALRSKPNHATQMNHILLKNHESQEDIREDGLVCFDLSIILSCVIIYILLQFLFLCLTFLHTYMKKKHSHNIS